MQTIRQIAAAALVTAGCLLFAAPLSGTAHAQGQGHTTCTVRSCQGTDCVIVEYGADVWLICPLEGIVVELA